MAKRAKKVKDHQYRSNSEFNTAQVLLKNNIDFKYETDPIEYVWIENKRYIPDFILPNGIILEVKGRFMLEDRKKHLFIRDQYGKDYDIRFVFDNPNRKLYKGGKMTYGDWCDKHGFLYCKQGEGIPQEWFHDRKNNRNRTRNKRAKVA